MADSALPRTFGRYEILDEIARGRGVVAYRARDPELERTVIVRVAQPPDLSGSEHAVFAARFLDEARRASLLVHPALVATHDFGQDPQTGALFVVQEHAVGTSLEKSLVPGRPFPWKQALSIASQIGRGLHRLHEAGVVHEDLRPGSIVVLDSGPCKLADPHLPRFEASPSTLTVVGQDSGALYTSPEQAVGERVDPRTDIFALGAVTYRLLTGHDAFEADGPQRILARVLHDRPSPPSRSVPGLPVGVDATVDRALAKSRKDRYADAASFCDDLDDLLAGRVPRGATAAPREGDRGRFLSAAIGTGVGTGTGTGSRGVDRRLVVRALVGLLAFALVLGLERLRRELEEPGAGPVGPPAPDPVARPEDSPGPADAAPDLPSLEPAPSARLSIDFRHTLENGTIVVRVDGNVVVQRRVTAAVTRRFLGIKLREGSSHHVVDVSPGRHEISVSVRWEHEERSDRIAGNFAAGATRKLTAKIGRIGRRLSIEWE